jgi:hypothetical protein
MKPILERFEQNRIECEEILADLLSKPIYSFDRSLSQALPKVHGLYIITMRDETNYVHVGVTKQNQKRKNGLYGRIWEDHFMWGNSGSDLLQKVKKIRKVSKAEAQQWITEQCRVQWLVETNQDLRNWVEKYAESLLRPSWSFLSSDEGLISTGTAFGKEGGLDVQANSH